MTELELPPVKRLEVVELRPGDTVIATLPDDTTHERAEKIRQQLQTRFPGHQIIIKPRSIDLEFQREP
jgi:hypothetical protein